MTDCFVEVADALQVACVVVVSRTQVYSCKFKVSLTKKKLTNKSYYFVSYFNFNVLLLLVKNIVGFKIKLYVPLIC